VASLVNGYNPPAHPLLLDRMRSGCWTKKFAVLGAEYDFLEGHDAFDRLRRRHARQFLNLIQ
jgi:hypothetical protein